MTQPQPGSIQLITAVAALDWCGTYLSLPTKITESFLIKITDDTKLRGIRKKVGIEIQMLYNVNRLKT